MSRLIDADDLKAYFFRPYSNEESYSNTDISKVIDKQPTIEPERKAVCSKHGLITDFRTKKKFETLKCVIIRCKDCFWHRHNNIGEMWCNHPHGLNGFVDPFEYCSKAERRN